MSHAVKRGPGEVQALRGPVLQRLAALAMPVQPLTNVITGDTRGQRHKETCEDIHMSHLLPVARRAASILYQIPTSAARKPGKISLPPGAILVHSANCINIHRSCIIRTSLKPMEAQL